MRPRLMNDHLGYKVSTPEEVGTQKEEVTNPDPMGGDETPPELAGQLNWDLLEPDSVEISLTAEPNTKDSPISCTMAYDTMAGVNYVTEGLVQKMKQRWPLQSSEEPLTQPLPVELGDSSIIALNRVTTPLSITQTTTWGTLASRRVRAVVVAGNNAIFTAGRPLLDKWGIGPQDALKQRAQVDAALERAKPPQQREYIKEEEINLEGVPFKRVSLLDPMEHATAVLSAIIERVKSAVEAGLSEEYARDLHCLLTNYQNIFRVSLQADPPLTVPPLHIKLKEGATPKRMKSRPMSPAERDWLWSYLDELESMGYVERVMTSEWASNGSAPAKPVEPGTEQKPDQAWG